MTVSTMTTDTTTSAPDGLLDPVAATARGAAPLAACAAAVAVVAGGVHGFGPDDESMVGHIHIALGHAIPIVAFALMIVWLAALVARTGHRCTRTQLVASAAAVLALVMWSAQTAVHSLGFYATAHIDLRVATELNKVSPPVLVAALFAASIVLVLAGLGTALGSAARRGLVPAVAAGLIVIGTLGSFFAGPVGDGVLALGLGWAAVRLSRSSIA
ncbi:MAG: hypothetical protein NVSMB16_13600 [Acidimicrobiales bacterium]